MLELLLDRYVYLLVLVLLAIGLYGVFAKTHLMQRVIGLVIFQTGIYLFFIEGAVKTGGEAPVIDPVEIGVQADQYVNPLPHLLILTAIVVGIGVVGVALSLLINLYRTEGTLEEADLIRRLADGSPPLDAGADHDDGDA